jgi:DNA-binding NarL/FixJ family response regulator
MENQEVIKVVLAVDHAVVRSGIRHFLEASGEILVVDEADDGEKAIALVEKHAPDVIVLDIQMPKATGIEVTRQLRKTEAKVGILILTAYDDDPYINAVLQAGANGFVLKTASPEEIIKAVKDVFEGKSVLDPTIAHRVLKKLTKGADDYLYEALTDRENEVLGLAAKGFTNKAIGVQLSISDRTVQGHLAHIFSKLQAGSRTEAVMRAVSLGWLPADISKIN